MCLVVAGAGAGAGAVIIIIVGSKIPVEGSGNLQQKLLQGRSNVRKSADAKQRKKSNRCKESRTQGKEVQTRQIIPVSYTHLTLPTN